MMFLIDTNIFLEILLKQEKSDICKKFLTRHGSELMISDFTLHSIGAILFRNNKERLFNSFLEDVMNNVTVLTLKRGLYKDLSRIREENQTDFDDSYQYLIAISNGLKIVTMDRDFLKFKGFDIIFL